MTEPHCVLGGDDGSEVRFDFVGIGLGGKSQALGEAQDVGVHTDGRLAEGIAQNDVGGFAADARQGEEVGETVGDLAAELSNEESGGLADGAGFVAVEVDLADVLFLELGPIGCGMVFLEELVGDCVDEVVAGFGGEDEGHEEFEGGGKLQREFGVGVGCVQDRQDLADAGLCRGWRGAGHDEGDDTQLVERVKYAPAGGLTLPGAARKMARM